MNEQENAIFSFDYVHDLRTHKDFQKSFALVRPANLILSCFIILYTIWNIKNIILWGDYFSKLQWMLSVIYGITLLIVWIRDRNGDINYKRMLDSNGGKPCRNLFEFKETTIEQTNPDTGNHGQITYDRIIKVFRTKENLILIMNYNQGFCVPRSALSDNEELFLSFLKERCINWKRKKVLTGLFGRVLNVLKYTLIVLALLITIVRPVFGLFDQLSSAPKNDMTCQEIVTMLEDLGITGADPDLLAELASDMNAYPEFYYNNTCKIFDVLFCMSYDIYNAETGEWAPAANGVFYFDMECGSIDTMYTDFLRGVSALDPELDFENIQEDISGANYDINKGKQSADFTWNGTSYRITGKVDYDWFDLGAADDLKNIIRDADTGKQLYFASDTDTGLIVFYRDAAWAKKFESATGIELYDSAVKLYYGIG